MMNMKILDKIIHELKQLRPLVKSLYPRIRLMDDAKPTPYMTTVDDLVARYLAYKTMLYAIPSIAPILAKYDFGDEKTEYSVGCFFRIKLLKYNDYVSAVFTFLFFDDATCSVVLPHKVTTILVLPRRPVLMGDVPYHEDFDKYFEAFVTHLYRVAPLTSSDRRAILEQIRDLLKDIHLIHSTILKAAKRAAREIGLV